MNMGSAKGTGVDDMDMLIIIQYGTEGKEYEAIGA